MLVIFCSCAKLAKAQYTNQEMAQAAFEECTWVSYEVGPATTWMDSKRNVFTNLYQMQLDWAERWELTPTQIAAIEALRDEGNALIADFNQKWHGDNFEINPSGLSTVYGDGYIWVYSFPELSDYQYMWAWYERGGYCMLAWQHPFDPDGLLPEAIDSYIEAQIRFQDYIRDCNMLAGQLFYIIADFDTFTPSYEYP